MALFGGNNNTSPFVARMIIFALVMMFLFPVAFTLYAPAITNNANYSDQIHALENEYYLSNGEQPTATTEIWALSGVYLPYAGLDYNYTPDGWIYGDLVKNYTPAQYPGTTAQYNNDDGLYYYSSVANTHNKTYAVGDLYTAVSMDTDHKSTVFFTADGKTTDADGRYYYQYNGYRYAFSPLRPITVETADGTQTHIEIQPNSSTLSLLFYQYATINGIAGQLSLSGSDGGISYLTGSDIVRNYNPATYSAKFDMQFNRIAMHLTIRLDVDKITAGMSPETAFNNGYWAVIVSSDAVASTSINDASYSFSVDNVFNTLVSLLTFRLTDQYDISGWLATLASLLVTMPLYAGLLAIALENYYIFILVAILGAIQAAASWWPF